MARGGGRPKHIPLRMCVACRQTSAKRSLIRLVRDPSGAVEVDPTGKRNGRGAYLCPVRRCWEQALRRGALEHALKTTLSTADRERLAAYGASLPEALPEP
ncbi:MAG: YlxR family protein [Chloroflexota bacterium]|nr:YlxR family protein [Dehalococcoidia bacterium]MDW8252436.1 YlxR family protein [Chloroflexota bacterium]